MIDFFLLSCVIQAIATSDQCGIPKFDPGTFAIAAVDSDSDVKAPWIAALGMKRKRTDGFMTFAVICSGVIISPRVVLTANHCLAKRPESIRAGVTRIDQANPQDRKIKGYITHPDHNNKDWYYDLALVLVTEEFNFNSKVTPLCLPNEPEIHPGDGVGILVQGWGEDWKGQGGREVTQVKVNIRSKE